MSHHERPPSSAGHASSMPVAEIVRQFEAGTLSIDAWTHRAHLGVALWNLRRYERSAAARRIRAGIRRHNARLGRSAGYHETITLAWIAIVARFLEQHDGATSGDAPADNYRSSDLDDILLDSLARECDVPRYLERFYTRERLLSDAARHRWTPPDREAPWRPIAESLACHLCDESTAEPVDASANVPEDESDAVPIDGPVAEASERTGGGAPAARRIALLVCASLLTLASTRFAQAQGSAKREFDGDIRAFLKTHCHACHEGDAAEAKLSIPALPPIAEDPTRWTTLHDTLRAGRMPPKDRPQPSAAEREGVVLRIGRQLHDASLAQQVRDGRVVLRRLNRTEYETTLKDLLGPQVEVKDLLPGDNVAAGFDNVSAALDVSSVHLLRYQEAAERALRTVIPRRKIERFHSRLTGRQVFEKQKQAKEMLGKSVRVEGDVFIQYVQPWSHISFGTATVPHDGRYRVRASLSARNSGGKPLPARFTAGWDWGRQETKTLAVRDATPDRPVEVEVEVDLKARELLDVTCWTLHTERQHREGKDKDKPFDSFPGLAIHWIEIEGPLEPWPPAGYTRLFGDLPFKEQYKGAPLEVDSKNPRSDADYLMRLFLPVAFRRPVDESVIAHYVKIVYEALERKSSFEDAMLLGYRAALCSPHFLFLTEPIFPSDSSPESRKVMPVWGRLDDYAVAARLSYFLWSTTPDSELIAFARRRQLTRPDVLWRQVERMLNDPRSRRFTENFAGQWLDLRQINATTPDPEVYGEFDPFLYWSMPRETTGFFETILREDRSLLEFARSDWTPLNERLAKHYGIEGVHGGELRRVALPADSHRGGLLTQAAILKVTADGTKTSPVLRGKWVLEKIVGKPPAPPPPGVAAIEPDIRGATTIREQLDKHRDVASCAVCHRHIDPPGFALESFDVIGGWRDFYRGTVVKRELWVPLANYPGRQVVRGPDVDPTGRTPEGESFRNIDEYKRLLIADPDQLVRNLATKLAIYATGADIQFADREEIERLVVKSRDSKRGFRSLIHDVVQSRLFLHK